MASGNMKVKSQRDWRSMTPGNKNQILRVHIDDMKDMFERSKAAGLHSFIITGGSLSESKHAIVLAKEHKLFCTAGCHPTRSAQFDKHPGGPEAYLKELDQLIDKHVGTADSETSERKIVVAIGECGLGVYLFFNLFLVTFSLSLISNVDYDRLHFASKETQMKKFREYIC
jgi:TatD DNase family protein